MAAFGSGWVWLAVDPGQQLTVMSTTGPDTPLLAGNTPLLGLSMWEHAYVLDYGDDKQAYVDAFWKCVDWRFVGSVARMVKELEGGTAQQ